MNNVHTPTMLQTGVTALFVGTWIVLGISGFINSNWFSPMQFRSNCGAVLDDKPDGSDN